MSIKPSRLSELSPQIIPPAMLEQLDTSLLARLQIEKTHIASGQVMRVQGDPCAVYSDLELNVQESNEGSFSILTEPPGIAVGYRVKMVDLMTSREDEWEQIRQVTTTLISQIVDRINDTFLSLTRRCAFTVGNITEVEDSLSLTTLAENLSGLVSESSNYENAVFLVPSNLLPDFVSLTASQYGVDFSTRSEVVNDSGVLGYLFGTKVLMVPSRRNQDGIFLVEPSAISHYAYPDDLSIDSYQDYSFRYQLETRLFARKYLVCTQPRKIRMIQFPV